MEELIVAVNKVADAVNAPMGIQEWISILVPIGISILALSISIVTVRLQKKMDLFDKRYDVYYEIEKL